MNSYMLDTSFAIDLVRNRAVKSDRLRIEAERLFMSAVAVAELLVGAVRRGARDQRVTALLSSVTVLPFDENAAEHMADIKVALGRAGTPIGAYDLLIAAHARSLGMVLVTSNLREFSRVDGLRSESWRLDA